MVVGFRVFGAHIILILISVLIGADPVWAQSVIESESRDELVNLGQALTKLSKEDCAEIESSKGRFQIDTLRCLPAPIRRLISEKPKIDGPNCYNFANMTSGLQPFVRYVSETESDYFVDPLAGYCTPIQGEPEPGDYAMITGRARGLSQAIHGYIYLNSTFAITKNGSDKAEPWKIGRLEEIREKFMAPSNYVGSEKEHSIDVTYYKCAAKGESKTPAIRALSKPLEAFGRAMEAPVLKRPITAAMTHEIRRTLQGMRKAFSPQAIKALNASGNRYEAMRPLLEVYSHIATFGQIDIGDVSGFETAKVGADFAKVREEYAAFVRDLVVKTDSQGLISQELL